AVAHGTRCRSQSQRVEKFCLSGLAPASFRPRWTRAGAARERWPGIAQVRPCCLTAAASSLFLLQVRGRAVVQTLAVEATVVAKGRVEVRGGTLKVTRGQANKASLEVGP